uniref:protein-serine/threonine phosphatase n=1 Tax=Oryza punctata TaxID=4537 RepID=A0A0E0K271_ORYPU
MEITAYSNRRLSTSHAEERAAAAVAADAAMAGAPSFFCAGGSSSCSTRPLAPHPYAPQPRAALHGSGAKDEEQGGGDRAKLELEEREAGARAAAGAEGEEPTEKRNHSGSESRRGGGGAGGGAEESPPPRPRPAYFARAPHRSAHVAPIGRPRQRERAKGHEPRDGCSSTVRSGASSHVGAIQRMRCGQVEESSVPCGEESKFCHGCIDQYQPSINIEVELDLDALKDTSFFGVYDGHGGAEVAMYCAKRFHVMLREEEDFLNNLPYAITSVCSRLDDELEAPNVWRASLHPHRSSESSDCFQFLNTGVCANMWHSPEAASYDLPSYEGSTACVVIIRGNQITVGNVGDSRCVLSKNGQAIDLSTDHKPNVQLERQRILRVGGQVWREKFPVKDSGGGIREQWGPYCVEGKLSTSRALGDFAYKNIVYQPQHQMVTHVPDIRVAKITGDTEFLVIASDGICSIQILIVNLNTFSPFRDHMSSQDVVDFVHEKLNLGEETLRTTCEKLVENCLESRNNATATLVQFKPGADQPIPVLPDIEEGSDEVAGGTSGARAEHQDKPEGSGEQQLDLDDDDAGQCSGGKPGEEGRCGRAAAVAEDEGVELADDDGERGVRVGGGGAPWTSAKASLAMGASASSSITSKLTNDGENQRFKYASSTMQGYCPTMQDALAVELDLDALKNTSFFGVYDGDGGAEVAMYCAKRFHAMLCEDENYLNNLPNAITSVCSRLDDDLQRSDEWRESLYPRGNGDCFQFLKTGVCANLWHSAEHAYMAPLYEGSTACVVIIRGNQITVGNVGDSRCVVSHNGQAIDLTIDHKPTVGSERERIVRAGGRVLAKRIPVMGSDGRLMRGWGVSRVQGLLHVSRAIGYFELKKNKNILPSQQMVTCDPEFTIVDITADTEFLVIATGSIWGHMSSQEVVDCIHKELHSGEENLRAACEKLLDHCLNSRNNVTAILVRFKPGAAVIPLLSDIDEEPVLSDVEEEPHEPQHNPGGGGGQQDTGGESEELPLAHFPQEYGLNFCVTTMGDLILDPYMEDAILDHPCLAELLADQTAPPMFGLFSGDGTPPMDTDTFLRAICALPPLAPEAPPPDSPRTPHTYGSFLPVCGDLPPLSGAVVQEAPVPLPEGGDHPVPPKKTIEVASLLPERADQPVVTNNSATNTRPQLCAPYDDDIEATLRAMEKNPAERPSPYFLETTQGGRMSGLVRTSMIASMDDFSLFHELAAGTLHRAAYYLDRYLSVTPESDDALQLRLVGATAVFLAAKYEDQYTLRKIDASMVAAWCGYTSETRHKMVSCMETEILAALDYNLGGPTAYTFVEHFTRYCGEGKEEKLVKQAAHRFADGTLLTYGFHRYLPSVVAASAIFLARLDVLAHEPWSKDLAELTGYKAIDLMGCVCDMYSQIACPCFALFQEYFFQDPFWYSDLSTYGPTADTFVEHFTRYSSWGELELRVQRLARDRRPPVTNELRLTGLPAVHGGGGRRRRPSSRGPDALVWSTELQELTGYSSEDLVSCILAMRATAMDSIMEPYVADLLADDITASMVELLYGGGGGGAVKMDVGVLDAYLRAIGALPAPGADLAPGYGVATAAEVGTMATYDATNGVLYDWHTKLDVKVRSALLLPAPGFPPLPVPALTDEPVYAALVDEGDAIRAFMEQLEWSEQYDDDDAPVPDNSTASRPQLCAPYDDDIDANLRAMEKDAAQRPSPDYLNTVHGGQISAAARASLVAWMGRLTNNYELAAGTLHRAVSYVDRFLSAGALPSYTAHQLSLLGATAVYTAAKYEDQETVFKLDAREIAVHGEFTSAQEVLAMESEMMAALGYRLGGPNAETFVEHFTRYSKGKEELRVQRLARHVADRSLENYGCLGYLPSVVAAAAISIARWTLNPPGALPWSTELKELTGYSSVDITSCILTLLNTQ